MFGYWSYIVPGPLPLALFRRYAGLRAACERIAYNVALFCSASDDPSAKGQRFTGCPFSFAGLRDCDIKPYVIAYAASGAFSFHPAELPSPHTLNAKKFMLQNRAVFIGAIGPSPLSNLAVKCLQV